MRLNLDHIGQIGLAVADVDYTPATQHAALACSWSYMLHGVALQF